VGNTPEHGIKWLEGTVGWHHRGHYGNWCCIVEGELSVAKFFVKSFKRGDSLDPRGCAPLASLYPKVPLLTAERSEGADEAELAGPHQSFLPPFPIRQRQRFHVSDHAPRTNAAQRGLIVH
jgi:hypothetical protein